MWTNDSVPYLQIRQGSLICYAQVEGGGRKKKNDFALTPKAYSGGMTEGARKRLRKCVDILRQISPEHIIFNTVTNDYQPFSLNFITLTIAHAKPLPADWCHKNLLEPFLRKMRSKWDLREYIWKVELQERGQIHYHLTTNTFIPWTAIRDTWNNLMRSNRLLDDFLLRNKHSDPNSIDVHSVYKVKNLGAYLCKYLCKDIGETKINAKLWDASKNLKAAEYFTITPGAREMINIDQLTRKTALMKKEKEHCTIYNLMGSSLTDILTPETYQQYLTHLQQILQSNTGHPLYKKGNAALQPPADNNQAQPDRHMQTKK